MIIQLYLDILFKMRIVACSSKIEASQKALELLKNTVDNTTLLLLSGGRSPEKLYKLIAQNELVFPGAVAMIDERFGVRMHDNSNERMIVESGLGEYLAKQGTLFYPILKEGLDIKSAAVDYEKTLKELFSKFPKRVAVMGIGADGHTASIKPDLEYDHQRWVVSFNDKEGFDERITTTFECLDQIDEFILLVFGEEKRNALNKMLTETDQQDLPAVFYIKTTAGVHLFTDLKI